MKRIYGSSGSPHLISVVLEAYQCVFPHMPLKQ